MEEQFLENKHRLNQESKKALLKLKQQPRPSGLYCLQLAEWGLEHSLEDQDGRLTETIRETMLTWKPERVMRYLTSDPETGEEVDPITWAEVENKPRELADQIVMIIHDNLTSQLDCYPQRNSNIYISEQTKKPKKVYPESVHQSQLDKMQSDWSSAIQKSNKELNLKPRDLPSKKKELKSTHEKIISYFQNATEKYNKELNLKPRDKK